ncbi:MAG: alpha-N-arabinofuranosidase [Caulobacteraceae bacterium]
MLHSKVVADADHVIDKLDRRVFGAFVEHLGRCVYGGIYEPGHPTADANGFRQDVLELTRELGPTIIRYPGGNFLSGYNWEDGVGPKEQRPVRLDLAWLTTETNQFGTNEFVDWCRLANVEPMFGVNLGTRGPDEARSFLEYCNHPGGTYWSDLRRSHGYDQPHDIRFWCLGNEMDGPWQICSKTATEYGRSVYETAKVMRMYDKTLVLAACGSSKRAMPTYGPWEYEVLDHAFEQVDFISLHEYFYNRENDITTFLSAIDDLDAFIREVVSIADSVAAKRRSSKKIMLSLDEWNVWYRTRSGEDIEPIGWPVAPHLLEEIYNFEDALMVGGALCVIMNNADRLKSACLAQLVNAIGAIFTETGGPAWRQTIFHPFAQASRYGYGEVLKTRIEAPSFSSAAYGAVSYLVTTTVHDPETGATTVFALNRHATESMELEVELCRMGGDRALAEALELHHADLKAINSKDAPDNISPKPHEAAQLSGGVLKAILKPLSWNVFVTQPS